MERFQREDQSFQQIWKATTVSPVPVAMVSRTRRLPFRWACTTESMAIPLVIVRRLAGGEVGGREQAFDGGCCQ